MKTIKRISYKDDHEQECVYTVGTYGVNKIEEHASQGEGDKWYYDVYKEGGEVIRLFSFEAVIFDL